MSNWADDPVLSGLVAGAFIGLGMLIIFTLLALFDGGDDD